MNRRLTTLALAALAFAGAAACTHPAPKTVPMPPGLETAPAAQPGPLLPGTE